MKAITCTIKLKSNGLYRYCNTFAESYTSNIDDGAHFKSMRRAKKSYWFKHTTQKGLWEIIPYVRKP